mmetsp:Transcript_14639/g.46566  ORF Transcript_14639/g.46566 Transcript_14639/m.46566 type:complete len:350 (+) Transcript_14639:23-1072(+)
MYGRLISPVMATGGRGLVGRTRPRAVKPRGPLSRTVTCVMVAFIFVSSLALALASRGALGDGAARVSAAQGGVVGIGPAGPTRPAPATEPGRQRDTNLPSALVAFALASPSGVPPDARAGACLSVREGCGGDGGYGGLYAGACGGPSSMFVGTSVGSQGKRRLESRLCPGQCLDASEGAGAREGGDPSPLVKLSPCSRHSEALSGSAGQLFILEKGGAWLAAAEPDPVSAQVAGGGSPQAFGGITARPLLVPGGLEGGEGAGTEPGLLLVPRWPRPGGRPAGAKGRTFRFNPPEGPDGRPLSPPPAAGHAISRRMDRDIFSSDGSSYLPSQGWTNVGGSGNARGELSKP